MERKIILLLNFNNTKIRRKSSFYLLEKDGFFIYADDRNSGSWRRKMWRYFNNNPVGRSVGDCAIRALSVVLDLTWEETFALVAAAAFGMGDMPSSNSVWGAVLRQNGFYKTVLPNTCPDCYTFADFAADHPTGTFVLGTGTHVAAVRDGDLIDAWDSSNEVPAFVWYKPQEGVDL